MKKTVMKLALVSLVAGMSLPLSAQAADDALMKKIEQMSQELEQLRSQVKANEEKANKAAEEKKNQVQKSDSKDIEELKRKVAKVEEKSLGRWLTIGGDYRFRVDSLYGQTKAYLDAPATFANAQLTMQSNYFNSAAPGAAFWQASLGQMMTFSQQMANVRTVDQANLFLGNNAAMVGGLMNFAVPVGAYAPKNQSLYTNKFGLDLTAKATQDVTVHAKLDMYKTFGSQDDSAVTGNYFADRVGVFDGTLGHVPSDGMLNVDRAFATWSNILDQPLWLSVGRRPSTNGAPSNLRLNNERPGNGGTPSLLVDYAFDGMTVGYAPDIESLPGAYAKVCYGRGFEAGINSSGKNNQPTNSLNDTDMLGIAVIPIDTDPLRVWLQWNRGFNIFDFPVMSNTVFGNTAPATNLGSIDWYGVGAMSTLKKVGPGNLNFFADFGLSVTHPSENVSGQAGFQGLMTGGFFAPENPTSRTGWAVYTGVRYDLPSKTKIGFEFNHGSGDWITFAPAADDMWTSKVGTRGNVYEPYIIQELDLKPISSYLSKTFFKIGYQYYDFQYTGSNNWVGKPIKISDVQANSMLLMAPVSKAHDVYATFEVKF
jgi:outer membrane murein-binding lipoprotein Lpp